MDDACQLSAFVAVAERLHIGRAAGQLGVHPATVAARLRSLESRVGSVLVDRRHRCRIAMTQAGDALLPAARRALEAMSAFETASDEVRAGTRGVVRVALTSEADRETDAVIDELRLVAPDWDVSVRRMDVHAAGRALAVGAVECSVGRGHLAPRTGPGAVDRRPNRLERVRLARVRRIRGDTGGRGLVIAWRTAWELGASEATAGSLHVAAVVGRLRRLRSIATEPRNAMGAAGRRTVDGQRRTVEERRRAVLAEQRLRAEEIGRFGVTEAAARARVRERAEVLRRVAEAQARGEGISVQLWISWLCIQDEERRGEARGPDDDDHRPGGGRRPA